jgi:integrase
MDLSNAPKLSNLNDVRLLLPVIYSAASAKVYEAVLNKAARLTGRKLTQLPAEERAWAELAATIVWAGEIRGDTPGKQQENFDAFVKKVGNAISRAKEHLATPVEAGDEDEAWFTIETYAREVENTSDAEGDLLLPNMFSLSVANLRARCRTTHPALLNTAVVTKALEAAPPDKASTLRNSVAAFNGLIVNRDRHPAIAHLLPARPIGPLPRLRDMPLDWNLFSPEFLESRDRAIRIAIRGTGRERDRFDGKLGTDPLAERRAARKGRRRPVRNTEARRKSHLNALSWLVRHAFPEREEAYALTSLEHLITEATVERAVKAYVARARASAVLSDPEDTASGTTILSTLETLARRNGHPQEVLWAIEDARYDDVDSYQAREMSVEREQFIKLIERDPAVARAIVAGPRRLAGEAQTAFANWESLGERARGEALHVGMGAALMALQLARSVRPRNLNGLTVDGPGAELIRPIRESRPWLDIARGRVKNRRPLEGEIPQRQWEVISLWLDEGLPRWCKAKGIDADANIYLVPGPNGLLSRQSFNRIWNRCMERLGIPGLQPHMMRHVAATLWLAAHPGDYATVAAFLGDSVKTVEKFYARGEGAAAARLFAEVLESLDPTLDSFLKRSAA